jgi:hypothetical protein
MGLERALRCVNDDKPPPAPLALPLLPLLLEL